MDIEKPVLSRRRAGSGVPCPLEPPWGFAGTNGCGGHASLAGYCWTGNGEVGDGVDMGTGVAPVSPALGCVLTFNFSFDRWWLRSPLGLGFRIWTG